MDETNKHILKIELFMEADGASRFEFDYSRHFFLFLKNNKEQREYLVAEMFEKLNEYIDEVKDGE
jgi:hypothetical protein